MNRVWLRWISPFVIAMLLPFASNAQEADRTAIRDLQAKQAEAWNRHDAAAYSELFEEDGDVVNVMGWLWRGRDEINRKLAGAFAHVFRESKLTITDVDVRFLEPNSAVAHVRWTMEGAKPPPGAPEPPRQGIQLQVLRKRNDRWRIVSFQNTNTIPEAEFPKGPPPPGQPNPR